MRKITDRTKQYMDVKEQKFDVTSPSRVFQFEIDIGQILTRLIFKFAEIHDIELD